MDGLSADYTVYAPECTGSPGGKSGENWEKIRQGKTCNKPKQTGKRDELEMFCPNCGANVQEEERKSSIKNCPQCSNECAVSAKFCTECGHKFEA